MIRLRRSIIFAFIARYSINVINLLMAAILARLLHPDEIGVLAIAAAIFMITEALRDFGTSVYLIQARDITPTGAGTAFTVMLILSLALAGTAYALAGPIAAFYLEPRLKPVLRIAALGFLIGPFLSPSLALLRRDMAFDAIAVIMISGAVVNLASAVALVLLGAGYAGPAWGSVIGGLASTALALLYRPQLWIFRLTLRDWRAVVSFGGYSSATAILNLFYMMLPQLALGRILGFEAVGLYSRATMLCQMTERTIASAIEPVVLPAFAAQVRSGDNLKYAYLRGISYMSVVQWPFLLCLALLSDPAVQLLFGPQWSAVAPLVSTMALASWALFPAFMTYPALVSVHRVRDTLILSLIVLPPCIAVIIGSAFAGLHWVAASLFLTAPLQIFASFTFIRRSIPFSWRELAAACRRSALVALGTAVIPLAAVAVEGFRFERPLAAMLIVVPGAAAAWLIGLLATDHPLLSEIGGKARVLSWLGTRPRTWLGRARHARPW